MAPHSSTIAWKIPWMEEPGGLQSMGSWRVRHDWVTSLSLFTFMHWRRKWQPTPVFLPGESQGRRSLVGCHLLVCTESDTTEVTSQQQQHRNLVQAKWKLKKDHLYTMVHWKRLWCWEGLGAGEEWDDRGWDGWMASLTWWTWVWVNSGSWWWTGRPGVLQFMGSQRVRYNLAAEQQIFE